MCKKKCKNLKLYICLAASLALSIFFLLNFKIIIVEGNSMQPTFNNGKILLAKKGGAFNKNDIIVFKYKDELLVKRIIAVGKDIVTLCDSSIYINDVKISPFSYEGDKKEYNLKDDYFFVIGDNYQQSIDSRSFGPVSKENIIGKVMFYD
ncbi:MAG: signal peptidase I [Clostridiales bacterium]|nr:signal peptidase I [Clostridiales bacterium]